MANYLYNGVEFPDINEVWTDKVKYPYAYIMCGYKTDADDSYSRRTGNLVLSSKPLYFKSEITSSLSVYSYLYAKSDCSRITYSYYRHLGDTQWGREALADVTADSYAWRDEFMSALWCNSDLYKYDSNEVACYASAPVPIGIAVYMDIGGVRKKVTAYKDIGGVRRKISEAGASLPAVGTSLEDCTWEQISAISAAGKAAEYFSVGDTKSVYLKGTVGTLALDTTLYVYILGFDHNSEVEGKGITFGTFKTAEGVDVALCDGNYGNATTNGTKYFNINHWGNYNYGGWSASDLRYDILGSTDVAPSNYGGAKKTSSVGYDATETCATNPVANTLMAALPSDLRAVMKPMTTYTDSKGNASNAEANVTASVDYLPLLAEYEVFGTRAYANTYEQNKQAQYAYFAAGNSKVKYKHSATGTSLSWWERSTYYGDRTNFCYANHKGNANIYNVFDSLGIAPIFLV